MNTAHSFIRFTLTGLLMVAGSLHTSVVADTNRQLSSTGQVERAMDNLLRSEAELTTPREIEGDPMSTMPVIQGPCDLYPIPVDPQGPTVTREFTSNDDGFTLTAWRYPCDSSTSHVIFTINPDEGVHPFICSSDLILVQDGIQTDEYKLTQNPGDVGDAHCGDVVVETSFALQAWRFASPLINLEESFDVYWDQGGYNEQFTMFAYDPSAYGGDPPDPELSNDMGISGLFYDPDNPGHGFDINMHEQALVIYYYGHAASGERLWLISENYYENLDYNTAIQLVMYEIAEGIFGLPDFQPTVWGNLLIEFHDCDSGAAVLDGVDGKVEIDFVRLTGLEGISCSP